jgi:hypothetical protein
MYWLPYTTQSLAAAVAFRYFLYEKLPTVRLMLGRSLALPVKQIDRLPVEGRSSHRKGET